MFLVKERNVDDKYGFCQLKVTGLVTNNNSMIKLSESLLYLAGIRMNLDNTAYEVYDVKSNELLSEKRANVVSKCKKKKEKRKKHAIQGVPDQVSSSPRGVHFGSVEEILFSRDLSFDAIPSRGGYPLGLNEFVGREPLKTVDEYCSLREKALIERAVKCQQASGSTPVSVSEVIHETRQYDFRFGVSNPLFQSTSEEDRVVILQATISHTQYKEHETDHKSHYISDINREVKSIRSTRDATGCSCKAAKLDKLSVVKMKNELKMNGHLTGIVDPSEIEKLSKAELVNAVRDVLKVCVICTDNNCECIQLCVPCSAEVRNLLLLLLLLLRLLLLLLLPLLQLLTLLLLQLLTLLLLHLILLHYFLSYYSYHYR